MSTLICGDVQSCFESLTKLLDQAKYDPKRDRLILAGDIVNRGPKSLETIDWIYSRKDRIEMVLGNHDLHLIGVFYGLRSRRPGDTLDDILESSHVENYIDWLCCQPFLIDDRDFIVCHAGLYPHLSKEKLLGLSRLAESLLSDKKTRRSFLKNIFSNKVEVLSSAKSYSEDDQLSFFVASITRMRCIYKQEPYALDFAFKAALADIPNALVPWQTKYNGKKVYHGHWAALGLKVWQNGVVSLDSGCVWGRELSLCVHETGEIISVSG